MGGSTTVAIDQHAGEASNELAMPSLSAPSDKTVTGGALKNGRTNSGRLPGISRSDSIALALHRIHFGFIKHAVPHHRTARRIS